MPFAAADFSSQKQRTGRSGVFVSMPTFKRFKAFPQMSSCAVKCPGGCECCIWHLLALLQLSDKKALYFLMAGLVHSLAGVTLQWWNKFIFVSYFHRQREELWSLTLGRVSVDICAWMILPAAGPARAVLLQAV